MKTSDLDYHLPPELIATHPASPRDHSRLLIYHRATGQIDHRHFFNLPEYLHPGDLLITNNTRVIPAKILLHRPTGALVPGLFLKEHQPGQWDVLLRTRGKVKTGQNLLGTPFTFTLTHRLPDKGAWRIQVTPPLPAFEILRQIGQIPLPPYIEKMRSQAPTSSHDDRSNYQTVYAHHGQSLAAPTAGLHFTPELLTQLHSTGIRRANVELTVGLGTFQPIETDTIEAHPMHEESFHIPSQTIHTLRQTRTNPSARIIPIGTTAVRTLESAAQKILSPCHPVTLSPCHEPPPTDIQGTTTLKIFPPYQFQLTDALITNFHLPRSTLLALVAALIGLEPLKELYSLAIHQKYRFYSYGDAMLILP